MKSLYDSLFLHQPGRRTPDSRTSACLSRRQSKGQTVIIQPLAYKKWWLAGKTMMLVPLACQCWHLIAVRERFADSVQTSVTQRPMNWWQNLGKMFWVGDANSKYSWPRNHHWFFSLKIFQILFITIWLCPAFKHYLLVDMKYVLLISPMYKRTCYLALILLKIKS